MREFFKVRLMYYDKRKAYLIEKLTEEWEKLDNKVFLIYIRALCVIHVIVGSLYSGGDCGEIGGVQSQEAGHPAGPEESRL